MTAARGPLSFEFTAACYSAVPTPPSDAAAYRGASLWCADDSANLS
jgi:hypothetical protein